MFAILNSSIGYFCGSLKKRKITPYWIIDVFY